MKIHRFALEIHENAWVLMKFHRRLIGSESVCAEEDAMTPPSTYAMRFHCFALLFGARAWDSVSASLDAMPLALVEDTTGTEQRIAGSMKNTADASVLWLFVDGHLRQAS